MILSDGSPANTLVLLAQYGAVGIIAILAITAVWILYKRQSAERDRERNELIALLTECKLRNDKLSEELSRLNLTVQNQTMTALNEATRAVTDAIGKMRRT